MGKRRCQRPLSDSYSDSDTDSGPPHIPRPASMDTDPHLTTTPPSSAHPWTDLPGTEPGGSQVGVGIHGGRRRNMRRTGIGVGIRVGVA